MSRDILMPIALDDIDVPEGRREVVAATVKRLADSIEQVGLRHPVTVRRKGERYELVAGRHRMEACRKLGREHVPACIVTMNKTEARLWEIAENLHRADLSNMEKAEQIDEWRKLTAEKVSNGSTPSGGTQPNESGVRKTAEALGVSKDTVANASKIASIAPEAKAAAAEAGVDTIRDLTEVARAPAEKQVATVHDIASRRQPSNHPKDEHERALEWRRAFERVWNQAPREEDREWARQWIDAPIMDEKWGATARTTSREH